MIRGLIIYATNKPLIQKTRGGANEAVKVFVELIKRVKISQLLLKNSVKN